MFVCGPTVYDYMHLGHARTYLPYDIMARYLASKGYRVRFIVNITDIDDKVFERAEQEGVPHDLLSGRYVRAFQEDMRQLGIDSVTDFPRASGHIEEVIRQVRGLLERGYAYPSDGNVYFDTSKVQDYGKLSHQTKVELKLKRLDLDPAKRNQEDFVLWGTKDVKEPTWPSPFGRGRPGWHIEDTAISISVFGPQYDIHGGAEELIYPHHEAEIAQAESYTGVKPFVKHWLHTGLLFVDGRKMSKSFGNYITVKESLARYGSDVLRIEFASHRYRDAVDFGEGELKAAERKVQLLQNALHRLEDASSSSYSGENRILTNALGKLERGFSRALDDDFDTPTAVRNLVSFAGLVNRSTDSQLRKGMQPTILPSFFSLASIIGILRRSTPKIALEAPRPP